jgi:zinc transport system ATP-binding protein
VSGKKESVMGGIVLDAQNISFGYSQLFVLENARFHLHEGDFAAIIGANGAGKSTLLKIMLGELSPQNGRVLLFGNDARSFKNWSAVAFLPQNTAQKLSAFPATALEVVSAAVLPLKAGFARALCKKRIVEAARNALSLTGMAHKARCSMLELSGGERQRVLLARALAREPRLLILDEPASGIDSRSVENLFALLAKLNKENALTIVMVTHDIARAIHAVNRIFCIEERNLQEITREQIQKEIGAKHLHTNEDPHGECRDAAL